MAVYLQCYMLARELAYFLLPQEVQWWILKWVEMKMK